MAMTPRPAAARPAIPAWIAAALALGCASTPATKYHDRNMDFGAIKTVAVLPFVNLSKDNLGADRVRDVFSNMLLASGAVYVLPQGEVAKGLLRAGVAIPTSPSKEEIVKLGQTLSADAVIAGTLKEYGELRAANTSANGISLSVQLFETSSGKVVWAASTTKGGITFVQRLLGGGGEPMNDVTEEAAGELLRKLFQ